LFFSQNAPEKNSLRDQDDGTAKSEGARIPLPPLYRGNRRMAHRHLLSTLHTTRPRRVRPVHEAASSSTISTSPQIRGDSRPES
ncbi:hypothetical protein PENTCL1PPCAC_1025, partial [Pristionchus entomophagus]